MPSTRTCRCTSTCTKKSGMAAPGRGGSGGRDTAPSATARRGFFLHRLNPAMPVDTINFPFVEAPARNVVMNKTIASSHFFSFLLALSVAVLQSCSPVVQTEFKKGSLLEERPTGKLVDLDDFRQDVRSRLGNGDVDVVGAGCQHMTGGPLAGASSSRRGLMSRIAIRRSPPVG